jgi:hypothetical protein
MIKSKYRGFDFPDKDKILITPPFMHWGRLVLCVTNADCHVSSFLGFQVKLSQYFRVRVVVCCCACVRNICIWIVC